MANILVRNGRRRRVLNEEALSASSAHVAYRAAARDDHATDDAPRYSEAAGVEHHPQVTDFLPRRFRSIALLAVVAIGSVAAAEALHWFVAPVVAGYAPEIAVPLELGAPGGVAAWLSAVVLLLTAAVCSLTYSLRRHRINDFRGRYRIWLVAAFACVFLSINSVAPFHRLIAAAATHYTGWTALRENAVWWLIVGGLPLGWIALRSWIDARESALAATAFTLALASYGVALASFLVGWPVAEPGGRLMVTAGATLAGHWALFVGAVSYGRFVVLDAQGLIPARRRPSQSRSGTAVGNGSSAGSEATVPTPSADASSAFQQQLRETERRSPAESRPTQWVDGSQPVDEEEDDDGPRDRKLSKAERKRLRKLKAQRRVA